MKPCLCWVRIKSFNFWISRDEHFFSRKKGFTDFATVITDIRGKRLYEIVEGKNKVALRAALARIPGRERVKIVAMDMSSTFKSFVQEFFPNAQIVADKFHVLRLLNPALIKLRKALSVNLSDTKYKKLMLKNSLESLFASITLYFERPLSSISL